MKQLIYILLLCAVGFVGFGCGSSKTANLSLELWCGPAEIPAQLNARATKVARSLSKRNNNVLVYCDSRDSVILSSFSAGPTGNILSIYTVKANSTTHFDTIYNQSFDWIYSFEPQKDAAYGFWNFPILDGSTVILFCNGAEVDAILPEYDQLQFINIDTISNPFYRNFAHLISDYISTTHH